MDYGKLIEAVKLCGSTPKIDQCKKCAYYAGGDMSKCIPVMTNEAANALSALQIDLASVRGAANSYKAENEKLRVELEAAESVVIKLNAEDKWISVEERLPDKELKEYQRMNHGGDRIEVIVLIEGTDEATTLDYNGEDFVNDWNDPFAVTHWMPIPQPPKEAKKVSKCEQCALKGTKPCYECNLCMGGDSHFKPISNPSKEALND